MASHDEVLKQINRSGYPLQLAVEHEIGRTKPSHGWKVETREHPWQSQDASESGFCDIVLTHSNMSACRLVLECKRMKAADERQLSWAFISTENGFDAVSRASCFEIYSRTRGSDSTWIDYRCWDNVRITPTTVQAEFCVLASDEPSRRPTLESLAANSLECTEGIANEEARVRKSQGRSSLGPEFFVPVIVTNAELVVCQFDAGHVALADGTVDPSHAKCESVPFLRFRKSLATEFPKGEIDNLKAANLARERTVFIVTASKIGDFLTGWSIDPVDNYSRFAIMEQAGL